MPRYPQAVTAVLTVALSGVVAIITAAAGQVGAQPAPAAHRALYELSLSRAASGSEIADVSGFLAFEWTESCDAWLTDQRFTLDYAYQNAEPTRFLSDLSSWEKKDGSRYRFDMRRTVDGALEEHITGRAVRGPDGRPKAMFERPEQKTFVLPNHALFPSDHLFALLDAAAKGERFVALPLFDGSEFEGAVPVTAFIHGPADDVDPGRALRSDQQIATALLDSPAYRIRLAFFEGKGNDATPAYEMTLTLHENGLVSGMTLDYDRFSLIGRLSGLSALSAPDC